MLVAPGPLSYFIYYSFHGSELRAHVQTQIPIRSQKTHYCALPKSRSIPDHLLTKATLESDNQRMKEQVIDRYFNIFKGWSATCQSN